MGRCSTHTRPARRGERFGLERDPGERRNLFYEQQDKVDELRDRLAQWDNAMNQSEPRFKVE
jgi:hypothetical protein